MRGAPRRSRPVGWAMLGAAAVTASGCISGRVLSGYPGYPFARFETELAADSAFFRLQPAVESEGFALDYTILDGGLITTRSAELVGRPIFLTVVVESREEEPEAPAGARVWVAAYEETVTGARRVNPLDEEAWTAVMEVSGRLSDSIGGTPPEGPSG